MTNMTRCGVALLTVIVVTVSVQILYYYLCNGCSSSLSLGGNGYGPVRQAGIKTFTPNFLNVNTVSLKRSLPKKVLKYLHPASSWKDVYHTGCCEDIYINVRTSLRTQERRLPVILTTWMQTLPPDQVNKMFQLSYNSCVFHYGLPCSIIDSFINRCST